MTRRDRQTRRTALKFIVATGTMALLAGCPDDNDVDDNDVDDNDVDDNDVDDNDVDDNDVDDEVTNDVETHTVTVTVQDEDEQPLEGATVHVEDIDEEDETDEDGQVEFDNLEDGEYMVRVEHEVGQEEGMVEIDGEDKSGTVTLGENDENDGTDDEENSVGSQGTMEFAWTSRQ